MIDIQTASLEDLDLLVPLFDNYRVFYEQQSNHDAARQFLTNRISKNESHIMLAVEDQKGVGFTQLYPLFSSVSMQRMHVLNDLYVLPDCRGKGIATLLLNSAKEFALKNESKGLALETNKTNPAQELYERLGWVKDEDYLHYFWKSNIPN